MGSSLLLLLAAGSCTTASIVLLGSDGGSARHDAAPTRRDSPEQRASTLLVAPLDDGPRAALALEERTGPPSDSDASRAGEVGFEPPAPPQDTDAVARRLGIHTSDPVARSRAVLVHTAATTEEKVAAMRRLGARAAAGESGTLDEACVAEVRRLLDTPLADPELLDELLRAVTHHGGSEFVASVSHLARSRGEARVRATAAEYLRGQLGDPEVYALLGHIAAYDADPDVRAAASLGGR